MRKTFILGIGLLMAGSVSAQKGFGLDGSLGLGLNSGDVNPILLEGRIQVNDFLSGNLGLGLWNSGYKAAWKEETATNGTLFRLSDSKALPSLQTGIKLQYPIGKVFGHDLRLFAEPGLIFLPFSGRKTYLSESYYTISEIDGVKTYTDGDPADNFSTSVSSPCHPRFYYTLQGGLSVSIHKDFDLSIGYGYSSIDLFKDLRGLTLRSVHLDDYLPTPGLQQVFVRIQYNYNLN